MSSEQNYLKKDEQERVELIRRLKQRMVNVTRYTETHKQDLRKYTPVGGAGFYAVVMKKGPVQTYTRKDGSGSWNRQAFDCLVGNVQHKGMDEKMFIGTSGIRIKVPAPADASVRTPVATVPGTVSVHSEEETHASESQALAVAPQQPLPVAANAVDDPYMSGDTPTRNVHDISLATVPEFYDIYSFSTVKMSTSETTSFKNVNSGDIIYLNGVYAKAAPPQGKYVNWTIFLNVNSVEKQGALSLLDLYNHKATAQYMPITWLKECTKDYDENKPSARYDRTETVIIDVSNPVDYDKGVQQGSLVVPRVETDEKYWIREDMEKQEHMKADLSYIIQQWKGDYAEAEQKKEIETILVGVIMYEEVLASFCITDPKQWAMIGPSIFQNLQYKLVGTVDIKNTLTNFGGINGKDDSVYKYALSLYVNCIIADVGAAYRKIGIPVSPEWIAKRYGASLPQTKDPAFIRDTVTSLRDDAPHIAAKLLGEGDVEFRVVLGVFIPPLVLREISKFSQEDGDLFMHALGNPTFTPEDMDTMSTHVQTLYTALNRDYMTTYVFALAEKIVAPGGEAVQETSIKKFINGTRFDGPKNTPLLLEPGKSSAQSNSNDNNVHRQIPVDDEDSTSGISGKKKTHIPIKGFGVATAEIKEMQKGMTERAVQATTEENNPGNSESLNPNRSQEADTELEIEEEIEYEENYVDDEEGYADEDRAKKMQEKEQEERERVQREREREREHRNKSKSVKKHHRSEAPEHAAEHAEDPSRKRLKKGPPIRDGRSSKYRDDRRRG